MEMDTLLDGLDRRTEEAQGAILRLEGVENIIDVLVHGDRKLGIEGSLLLMKGLREAALVAKRALQTCRWAEDDVKNALAEAREEIGDLTHERDQLKKTNDGVEVSFTRFSAFVNWVVRQGHADTNPTNVMCGLHESCPENALPAEGEGKTIIG